MTHVISFRRGGAAKERDNSSINETKWVGAFLTLFLLMGCFVGLASFHVWSRLQVVRMGYVLSATSKLHKKLSEENKELSLELSTLSSPGRLRTMVRSRLGMRQAGESQLVILP